MRKIASSPKFSCSVAFSAFADSRSEPKGFSRTIRARSSASPLSPSIPTIGRMADGGTDR